MIQTTLGMKYISEIIQVAFSDKENGKVSEITNLHDTQTNTSLELIKNEDPTVFSVN